MKEAHFDENRGGLSCFKTHEYSNAHHDSTSYGSIRTGTP